MTTIWQKLKQLSHTIGDFQARVLLTLLYILFIAPVGIALRLSEDVLRQRAKPINGSYWQQRVPLESNLRQAQMQG